jgi:predicted restriction endonuclease
MIVDVDTSANGNHQFSWNFRKQRLKEEINRKINKNQAIKKAFTSPSSIVSSVPPFN